MRPRRLIRSFLEGVARAVENGAGPQEGTSGGPTVPSAGPGSSKNLPPEIVHPAAMKQDHATMLLEVGTAIRAQSKLQHYPLGEGVTEEDLEALRDYACVNIGPGGRGANWG